MTPHQMRRMASQMPDNGGKFDLEVAVCLHGGADEIDRLQHQLYIERTVNEQLRGIKKPYRPNWVLRAAVVMGALLVFSVAWPGLQYVFNPGSGASW